MSMNDGSYQDEERSEELPVDPPPDADPEAEHDVNVFTKSLTT